MFCEDPSLHFYYWCDNQQSWCTIHEKLTRIEDFKLNLRGKKYATSQRLWTGSIQRTWTSIQKLCTAFIECCSLISATHYTSRCKSKVKT